jgi:hypothetical protein
MRSQQFSCHRFAGQDNSRIIDELKHSMAAYGGFKTIDRPKA